MTPTQNYKGGLHLSLTKDGLLSLWDDEKSASSQKGESYVHLVLTPEQVAIIERLMWRMSGSPKDGWPLPDPAPDGYLLPVMAYEPCQDCGKSAPVYRLAEDPDYCEAVCDCGSVSVADVEVS